MWHTVWNKVYRRNLLVKCLPFFENIPDKLTMGEDIVYSSVFYTQADKLSFCDNDCYFYYRHSGASTSTTLSEERVKKNIIDICFDFDFVEEYLKKIGRYNLFKYDFRLFKEKYFRIWSNNASATQNEEICSVLLKKFNKKKLELSLPHDFFFYESTTPWDCRYESLRESIVCRNHSVISFDIFDTLITRPVWEPSDLFKLMLLNTQYSRETCSNLIEMRKIAEDDCRFNQHLTNAAIEDTTLSDIYLNMEKLFDVDSIIINKLKSLEIQTEYDLCEPRVAGRELFKLARYLGKKVILISDMYLELSTIECLLKKCGISGYDKIYLSSNEKKLKATGNLFSEAIKDLGCSASDILHIGDNWESDCVMSQKQGMAAKFFPKAIEVYKNAISDIFSGESYRNINSGNNPIIDTHAAISQLPIRCMLASASNDMFTIPFRSFNTQTNYDIDPYYIGYTVLSSHIFTIANWLYNCCLKNNYTKMIFYARDGALVKKIFDKIVLAGNKSIKSSYVYITRSALMPYSFETKKDLYNLDGIVNFTEQTPLDILEFCSPCLIKSDDTVFNKYKLAGVSLDSKFSNRMEFFKFIKIMGDISFDEDISYNSRKLLGAHLSKLFDGNCACFDIGYSGRIQKTVNDLIGKSVNVYYLHSNGDTTADELKNSCEFESFYEYTPRITSILRETLISEIGPSCRKYGLTDEKLEYIFDQSKLKYSEIYAVEEIHRGVIDSCDKFINRFSRYLSSFYLRNFEGSVFFENFLFNATPLDRKVMVCTPIEDKVYSGFEKKSFFEAWEWRISQMSSPNAFSPHFSHEPVEHVEWSRKLCVLKFLNLTFTRPEKVRVEYEKYLATQPPRKPGNLYAMLSYLDKLKTLILLNLRKEEL